MRERERERERERGRERGRERERERENVYVCMNGSCDTQCGRILTICPVLMRICSVPFAPRPAPDIYMCVVCARGRVGERGKEGERETEIERAKDRKQERKRGERERRERVSVCL